MRKLKKLFEPIKVGQLELKNRMVMLAMGTHLCDGVVNARLTNYFAERAKGGAGLVLVPFSPIYQGYHAPGEIPYFAWHLPGIYEDELLPDIRSFVGVLHAQSQDVKVAAQIQILDKWAKDKNSPLEWVGPSAVAKPHGPTPRELTVEEIGQIVERFGEAARRAREAGFDAVEIYAGMGFLLNQFLSSYTNRRTDQYGGTPENRAQIVVEVIASIQKKAGKDYTISCRISGADLLEEGGNTLEDTKRIAVVLEKAGLNVLNVQAGWLESNVPIINFFVPRGAFVYLAEGIKRVVNIPVVTAYRINDPFVAEKILAQGRADLIGMGRALIADPEFPNKAREGRFDEIRRCIACTRCIDLVHAHPIVQPVACSVNARVGKEAEYTIKPTQEPKKVLVIGGGPGGMEAARVAVHRGHKVTLVDRSYRLGGAMLLAGVLQPEIPTFIKYLGGQMRRLPIEVKLNTEVTAAFVEKMKPDVVIVATGGVPRTLDVPGVDRPNVLSGRTMLDAMTMDRLPSKGGLGQKLLWRFSSPIMKYGYHPKLINWGLRLPFPFKKRVVIIGGGFAGCEVADALIDKGKKVTVLEEGPRLGYDVGLSNIWAIKKKMKEFGATTATNAKVVEITEKGVKALVGGSEKFFEADTVVLALPLQANDRLSKELEGKGLVVRTVGDAASPGKIMEAVAAGFRAGFEI